VIAVEEHEQHEHQRCHEMGELEPLVAHGSVSRSVQSTIGSPRLVAHRIGANDANVNQA
jgi:hypothetical protein